MIVFPAAADQQSQYYGLAQGPISTRAGLIYYAQGHLLERFNPIFRVAARQTLRIEGAHQSIPC
jgi:hypothetical protein